MANGNSELISKITKVIEDGGVIDPKVANILIFSAIADIYSDIEEIKTKSIKEITSALQPIISFYKFGVWIGGAMGLLIIGFFFSLLTGQVQVVFP